MPRRDPALAGGRLSPDRPQRWLVVASVVSYAVGYPVALVAGWAVGWVLVSLGGLFLLGLGFVTVRRTQQTGPSAPADDPDG